MGPVDLLTQIIEGPPGLTPPPPPSNQQYTLFSFEELILIFFPFCIYTYISPL